MVPFFVHSFIENGRKICDGTCVTPQICTDNQACKTAVTIGDKKYCTECVTAKTCGTEEKCIPEAIDAITEKPYCPETSTCQHVCEIYAGDIGLRYIVSGTSASDSDSCFISKNSSSWGGYGDKIVSYPKEDTTYQCIAHYKCQQKLSEECMKTGLYDDVEQVPTYYDKDKNGVQDSDEPKVKDCESYSYGFNNYCHEDAYVCEKCGTHRYSDKCCLKASSGDIFMAGDRIEEFNSKISRGYKNVTENYYAGGSSNCLYARCEGSVNSYDICCPKAKDDHKLLNSTYMDERDEDVTNEYGPDVPEGCKYVKNLAIGQ